ncbi:DUF397 domain-containing protein [Streptomyces sp. NPDC090083]|uniref:DUF397 domain-containing protein n=1 Tax=Streptomyces sp. NPDC090083 TaxID=3365941 RepID=UPI0037FE8F0D
MSAPSTHHWFKSSYSGGSGTECVECARTQDGALIRDSKNQGGSSLTVRRQAWLTFTQALRDSGLIQR